MTSVLETLRRLQKRRSGKPQETRTPAGGARGPEPPVSVSPVETRKAAGTREDFLHRIREAQGRVGAVYPEGLLESLNEAEGRLLDEAEERMEAALQAGDLEAASASLEEWERRWMETIRMKEGEGDD